MSEVQTASGLKFTDAGSCKAWVRGLPLTNYAQAQAELSDQIFRLNQATLAPAERFKILELLRESILFVQTEVAKKFTNKPLPLADAERKAFQAVVELWQVAGEGYGICVQACVDGDATVSKHNAAICHRAMTCTANGVADHLRANHQFPDIYWTRLHGLYRKAEQLNVADAAVVEGGREKSERSCKGAYVAVVLMVLANPHEMFQRHIGMVARWIERWAEKAVILKAAPEASEKPAIMIDLASKSGGTRNGAPGAEPRWIDIDGLSHTMKKRVHYLRKGEKTPVELGLGEDCAQPGCEALLVLLYQHWCDGREARAHPRRSVDATAKACSGIEAMHFHILGSTFRQPDTRSEIDRMHHRDEIATFGHVIRRDQEHAVAHGFVQEEWRIENETVAGLRMVRPAGTPGARLSQLQLIAVRPQDSKGYMLGMIRWVVMVGEDLVIGVRLLPGVPEPVGVRGTGINSRGERFQQAFLMPPVAALQSPASAVLPLGVFRPDKVMEVHTVEISKIKLIESLERGFDYERVSFSLT